jgi:ferredoxin
VSGRAIITEACIDVKARACVDVCPVQCIYDFDGEKNVLFSEDVAGSGVIETIHTAALDAIGIFGDSILYVNLDEYTSCSACYQPDVCPVGAIYSEEHLPDGSPAGAKHTRADPNVGHDHTLFLQQPRRVRWLGSHRRFGPTTAPASVPTMSVA